ncbi:efflux RND transporter periplasmic adaptor subunit [Acerihabitans sp. TG2]|uniref:efflux RND transporter periplasmic adaptor subunit n=1 Tax=Acerihabitans sp. TG2 TaxID=3096008 RepID=UPI002B23E44A|nr:efflux RND transporter periplasmic adaptor subunit [Acerihabitans sp. TG2]MEA9391565.1 efflux RND transporter periplasmic adaptor subunit [Acerihabitans sp. TG2]
MHRKIYIASMVILLSACDRAASPRIQAVIPEVDVMTLHTQPVALSTSLPGRTSPVRSAEVRPQVNGIILKRYFVEGSDVKAGQQLYQIDPATYQAAYDKAAATLANASALAKRYKSLSQAHAISQQQYDDAVASEKEAAADVETARVNLTYTKVLAPISGHIGRSLFTEGALVTNGQSSYLTTIQQLNPIYVDVTESSQDLLRLRHALASGKLKSAGDNAAAVGLILADGSHYSHEGKLEFSEVTVDEGTGSVTMRASFPNAGGELLPGMFVHAMLSQGVQEQGILVAQEAVGRDVKGRPYVYVVTHDNTVEQRTITTDRMYGDSWLVTQGLRAGERVITQGLQNVRVGGNVKATEQIEDKTAPSVTNNLSMTDPSAR